jgi:2'-5' RNA ligase
MQAVISTDDQPGRRVQVPTAHLTYFGAAAYDHEQVQGMLLQIAAEMEPFPIETDGLGIFTGSVSVLYVPVVRSSTLTQLHQRLWQVISQAGRSTMVVYVPEQWIRHIKLVQCGLTRAPLAAIVGRLSSSQFHWHILLTNLALITKDDSRDVSYSVERELGACIGGDLDFMSV